MEFLITMTTHVPGGTSDDAVAEMRGREAVRARELAAQGSLLRLWRPPLQPGEWRTLGLFAAQDGDELEAALASMPLRVWRSDEITPLSRHPNDPATSSPPNGAAEFLTEFRLAVPAGTPCATVEETMAREAQRARVLAEQRHLVRLWVLPGEGRTLGLWRAKDGLEMEAILDSLPLDDWLTTVTTPLDPHPSDPALVAT
jgi:muconolactone delta-isomerase